MFYRPTSFLKRVVHLKKSQAISPVETVTALGGSLFFGRCSSSNVYARVKICRERRRTVAWDAYDSERPRSVSRVDCKYFSKNMVEIVMKLSLDVLNSSVPTAVCTRTYIHSIDLKNVWKLSVWPTRVLYIFCRLQSKIRIFYFKNELHKRRLAIRVSNVFRLLRIFREMHFDVPAAYFAHRRTRFIIMTQIPVLYVENRLIRKRKRGSAKTV